VEVQQEKMNAHKTESDNDFQALYIEGTSGRILNFWRGVKAFWFRSRDQWDRYVLLILVTSILFFM
jgi:hypothetical protein